MFNPIHEAVGCAGLSKHGRVYLVVDCFEAVALKFEVDCRVVAVLVEFAVHDFLEADCFDEHGEAKSAHVWLVFEVAFYEVWWKPCVAVNA